MIRNITEAIKRISEETGIAPKKIKKDKIVIETENKEGYIVLEEGQKNEYKYSKLKEGSKVYINEMLVQDTDLLDWLAEQPINEFKVYATDFESQMVWLENCPFGIESENIEVL